MLSIFGTGAVETFCKCLESFQDVLLNLLGRSKEVFPFPPNSANWRASISVSEVLYSFIFLMLVVYHIHTRAHTYPPHAEQSHLS